jgi:uncharacterized protein with HEPN domain
MYATKHRAADCLQDALDNIAHIEQFVEHHKGADIERDPVRSAALERCLQRICEAAFRLGDQASIMMPDHPWQDIRGLGNRLRHAYDRLDFDVVWRVVTQEIPRLKADAYIALERQQSEDPA